MRERETQRGKKRTELVLDTHTHTGTQRTLFTGNNVTDPTKLPWKKSKNLPSPLKMLWHKNCNAKAADTTR